MPHRQPEALIEAEVETLAKKHEAFGFGAIDSKGYTTHGFDPDGLHAFVQELIAKRDEQWKQLLRHN